MDITCACKGVELFREMVQGYTQIAWENPMVMKKLVPRMDKVAANLYDHITTQANKPGNEQLRAQVADDLAYVRGEMGTCAVANKYADAPTLHGVESLRTKIHKNTAMKQLLLCGVPDSQDVSIQLLSLASNIVSGEAPEDDPADGMRPLKEALPVIDDLKALLGCCDL